MKPEYIRDPFERIRAKYEVAVYTMKQNLSILDGASHANRWQSHQDRGWYMVVVENELNIAKQDFYVCGRLDEKYNNLMYGVEYSEPSHSIWNAEAVDGYFHLLNVLLSDNATLIKRRTSLTYPERDRYLFKQIYEVVVVDVVISQILLGNFSKASELIEQMEKGRKAKNFIFDKLFFEAFLTENRDGMVTAIEGVSSAKIHRLRHKSSTNGYPGEFSLLSLFGIMYTKLAWMFGFELEIKNPLVSIANELYPVKPLPVYDEVYELLRQDKAERGLE